MKSNEQLASYPHPLRGPGPEKTFTIPAPPPEVAALIAAMRASKK